MKLTSGKEKKMGHRKEGNSELYAQWLSLSSGQCDPFTPGSTHGIQGQGYSWV